MKIRRDTKAQTQGKLQPTKGLIQMGHLSGMKNNYFENEIKKSALSKITEEVQMEAFTFFNWI